MCVLVQEFNNGAHWRLTLPACRVSAEKDDSFPKCPKPLHLKFELLYAPFVAQPEGVKVDMMNEIEKLIPMDAAYAIVATQNLVVDDAGSGIHAYYPVCLNTFFNHSPKVAC